MGSKGMECSLSTALRIIENQWTKCDEHIAFCLVSEPGMGKTSILSQLAEKLKYRLTPVRAAMIDGPEINGYPKVVGDKMVHISPDFVPGPEEHHIFFADELNRGTRAALQVFFRIIEGEGTDSWKFNSKYHKVIIAINPPDTNDVENLGKAMCNRVQMLYIKPSVHDFLKYGYAKGFDERVLHFIASNEKYLHVMPNEEQEMYDVPWGSPRSYENVSRMIKIQDPKDIPFVVTGALGMEIGNKFLVEMNDKDKPVTAKEIIDTKFGKAAKDKFDRHIDKASTKQKAFATVLDLTAKLNSMDVKKIDMSTIKSFFESITAEEIRTTFINGLEQDDKGRFDALIDICSTNDLKNVQQTFTDIKKDMNK